MSLRVSFSQVVVRVFRLIGSYHLKPPLRGSTQDGSTDVSYETSKEESVNDLGSDAGLSRGNGEDRSLHACQEGTLSAVKVVGFHQWRGTYNDCQVIISVL